MNLIAQLVCTSNDHYVVNCGRDLKKNIILRKPHCTWLISENAELAHLVLARGNTAGSVLFLTRGSRPVVSLKPGNGWHTGQHCLPSSILILTIMSPEARALKWWWHNLEKVVGSLAVTCFPFRAFVRPVINV